MCFYEIFSFWFYIVECVHGINIVSRTISVFYDNFTYQFHIGYFIYPENWVGILMSYVIKRNRDELCHKKKYKLLIFYYRKHVSNR